MVAQLMIKNSFLNYPDSSFTIPWRNLTFLEIPSWRNVQLLEIFPQHFRSAKSGDSIATHTDEMSKPCPQSSNLQKSWENIPSRDFATSEDVIDESHRENGSVAKCWREPRSGSDIAASSFPASFAARERN